ncbi:MAG: hypothetical protein IRY85_09975 [Micromonosporaceae bacterium]|nr:hypothetical protein [Micromonosporaceae bacterium]
MSDSAELTHDVLLRVAEFLRKLPADQLEDLASGTAHLQVVSRSPVEAVRRQRLPVREKTPVVSMPRPIEQIGADLASFTDRAAAAAYLDDLKLSVAQLRSLAAGLGIAVSSKATKMQARDTIIQWTVGRRADAAVLARPGARRLF